MIKLKRGFLWCLLIVVSGCAPQTAPPDAIISKTSVCVSPIATATPFVGSKAAYIAERLNADTSAKIANLEYLISQIDPDYSCGAFFQETSTGAVRGVRVYKVTQGEQAYTSSESQLERAFSQINLPFDTTSVVLLADFGSGARAIVKTGWENKEVNASSVQASKRALYTRLATSNKSLFSTTAGLSRSSGDRYNCADFSSQAAAQAFFSGLQDDVNRLDADNDGVACEALDNVSRSYQVTLADLPAPKVTTVPTTRTYTPPSSSNSGRCYVRGYTRKNGTRVSGYYRRC